MRSKHAWLAVQALVTAALLVTLFRVLDLEAFGRLFASLPLWFYAVSLALILGGQALYAWRWWVLLVAAGVRVSYAHVLRQYFIGVFVNNFLPSTVGGDVAKVYYLGRDHGYRTVTASVILDRILGIGLLSLYSAGVLWLAPIEAAPLAAARLAVTGVAGAAVVLMGVVAFGTGGLPDRVRGLGAFAVRQAERLQRLRIDMAGPLTHPVVLLKAALVVAVYFVAVTAVYEGFLALQADVVPGVWLVFGVVSATTVLSNIPVALNGLGLREQLHAVLLAPLGVAPEAAVAISLLFFGHLIIASLIGLAFWLQAPPAVPERALGAQLDA